MEFDLFKSVSHAVKKAGVTVASTVTGAATTILRTGSGVAAFYDIFARAQYIMAQIALSNMPERLCYNDKMDGM